MQFNRYIKIVIKNFDTKQELTVTSEEGFRIDFDYNEYLDESSSSNTGTIKIYNLSQSTFEKIGQRYKTEVEIWCGYKNEKLNTVGRLCIGALTSKSRDREGSDFVTSISFQTALKQMYAGEKISASYPPKTTLITVLQDVAEKAGFTTGGLAISEEERTLYGDAMLDKLTRINFPHGVSFHGNPKQVFDQICEMFSLGYYTNPRDMDGINFYVTEQGWYKLGVVSESLHTGNDVKTPVAITNDRGKAQVLTMETGLVGTPYVETVETTTGYFEALDENEELIYKKEVTVRVNSKGEVIKDKDGNVKYTKPAKNKTIARNVVNAKALINPAIKPNSWIKLLRTINRVDGFYRVRNIKYVASTHENNSFTMEMTLTHMADADG